MSDLNSICAWPYLETTIVRRWVSRASNGGNLQVSQTRCRTRTKEREQKTRGSRAMLGPWNARMQGVHTSHRDIGVGMARSMIGLSLGLALAFLGRQRLDKFYQLSAHDAVSKGFYPGRGQSHGSSVFWTRRNARKRQTAPRCLFMKSSACSG